MSLPAQRPSLRSLSLSTITRPGSRFRRPTRARTSRLSEPSDAETAMVSEYEARQLQRDMHHELAGGPGMVRKCAVGLAVVAIIAVMGANSAHRDSGPTSQL